MLEFLLALLTTATVGVLLIPLLRARNPSTDRFDGELAIYRDQLAEIERERAAGTLPAADAAAAKIEIERRILAAADGAKPAAPAASPTLHKLLPPALALAIPLLALGLYLQVGRPRLPSSPFGAPVVAGAKPAQPNEPLSIAKLLADARARVAAQPADPDAQSALGEALTLEADGTVTAPAIEAFNKALSGQPDDPRALYYLGLHEAQSGDSRAALERWRQLEARSPANAPWLAMLRAEIERVAKAAGIDLPPSAKSPSREQVEAMQNLAPEQRQQAIRGMRLGRGPCPPAQARRDAVARGGRRAAAPGEGRAAQCAGAVLSRRRLVRGRRQAGGGPTLEDSVGAPARRRAHPRHAGAAHHGGGRQVGRHWLGVIPRP